MCNLKALDALTAAGMTGSDATTSLDTLIRRLVEVTVHETRDLTPAERHERVQSLVGSDAIRAFSVLAGGAE